MSFTPQDTTRFVDIFGTGKNPLKVKMPVISEKSCLIYTQGNVKLFVLKSKLYNLPSGLPWQYIIAWCPYCRAKTNKKLKPFLFLLVEKKQTLICAYAYSKT